MSNPAKKAFAAWANEYDHESDEWLDMPVSDFFEAGYAAALFAAEARIRELEASCGHCGELEAAFERAEKAEAALASERKAREEAEVALANLAAKSAQLAWAKREDAEARALAAESRLATARREGASAMRERAAREARSWHHPEWPGANIIADAIHALAVEESPPSGGERGGEGLAPADGARVLLSGTITGRCSINPPPWVSVRLDGGERFSLEAPFGSIYAFLPGGERGGEPGGEAAPDGMEWSEKSKSWVFK